MNSAIEDFRLEEYLATREFSSKYMFCASDLESRSVADVLKLLGESEKQQFLDLMLSYTPTEGTQEFREAVSSLYKDIGSEQVLCFAGAEEAIYASAKALLTASDHAVAISPCYQSLASVARSVCDVSTVELQLQNNSWFLDPDAIAAAIRPNTKMLFINFPHNPSGFIPSLECYRAIIDLARERGITVFADEVYRGIARNPQDTLPSACEIYPEAVSLGGMSKAFGCGGLRVGWLASQNTALLGRLAKYKHYLSICNSAPSEWLAGSILKKRKQILRENRELVLRNYEIVRKYFLSRPDLFAWIDAQGGCTAYPRYLGQEPIFRLADKLLQSKGVVIIPDWVYGQSNQHFRVAYGRKNCQEALAHFADFFKDYSG